MLTLLLPCVVIGTNMNTGGVPYNISNADSSAYPLDFVRSVEGRVEFFDVYGEVQTRYSQVYWTRNAPIDLPLALVERFKGKVMSIVGYEVDQVTHEGPRPPPPPSGAKDAPLSGFACFPSCEVKDTSVPIYHAYNHHYFSWLVSAGGEVVDLDRPVNAPNPTRTGVRERPGARGDGYPSSIVFKENPGGEFRKSYHGYPSGYAQLVASPAQWIVEPMQIDTHNRSYGINEQIGLQPSFLPRTDGDAAPTGARRLSPLIECPCSDRVARKVLQTPVMRASATTCDAASANISTASACFDAVAAVARASANRTVAVSTRPAGCSIEAREGGSDGAAVAYDAVFNSLAGSPADCSGPPPAAAMARSRSAATPLSEISPTSRSSTAAARRR